MCAPRRSGFHTRTAAKAAKVRRQAHKSQASPRLTAAGSRPFARAAYIAYALCVKLCPLQLRAAMFVLVLCAGCRAPLQLPEASIQGFSTGNGVTVTDVRFPCPAIGGALERRGFASLTAVQQAVGTAKANEAGAAWLRSFVEAAKASGLVAKFIAQHKVNGLSVAPPG